MATDYFSDAQSLPTREFTTSSEEQVPTSARRGSGASSDSGPELRLTQALAGFSIVLGLAQLLAPRAVGRAIGVGEFPVLMRLLGVREITSGLGLLSRRQPSRWSWSRVIGDAIDLGLLGAAATRANGDMRRIASAAVTVAGVTALDVYASRRLRGISALAAPGVEIYETIVINADPATLYDFWSRVENLPRFMQHLERVTPKDERVSHWVARGPAGTRVEWDSQIVAAEPNRRIAWQTLPGSQIEHEGSVSFAPAAGGRGTRLDVQLCYLPPVGRAAVPIARLLGEEPRVQINADLRRLKQVIETGEIASTSGQPSGRRSMLGRVTLGRGLS